MKKSDQDKLMTNSKKVYHTPETRSEASCVGFKKMIEDRDCADMLLRS